MSQGYLMRMDRANWARVMTCFNGLHISPLKEVSSIYKCGQSRSKDFMSRPCQHQCATEKMVVAIAREAKGQFSQLM